MCDLKEDSQFILWNPKYKEKRVTGTKKLPKNLMDESFQD